VKADECVHVPNLETPQSERGWISKGLGAELAEFKTQPKAKLLKGRNNKSHFHKNTSYQKQNTICLSTSLTYVVVYHEVCLQSGISPAKDAAADVDLHMRMHAQIMQPV